MFLILELNASPERPQTFHEATLLTHQVEDAPSRFSSGRSTPRSKEPVALPHIAVCGGSPHLSSPDIHARVGDGSLRSRMRAGSISSSAQDAARS